MDSAARRQSSVDQQTKKAPDQKRTVPRFMNDQIKKKKNKRQKAGQKRRQQQWRLVKRVNTRITKRLMQPYHTSFQKPEFIPRIINWKLLVYAGLISAYLPRDSMLPWSCNRVCCESSTKQQSHMEDQGVRW
jgi:hypothetical protein